ncbi:MAG: Holliday junction resolvase RuvX [Legionellales bacterium]|nr:Holliday junction resolvase RuvX [Legionellales bacterium]
MPDVVLGFDFGMKRIGVAVGQTITDQARPLTTLTAIQGLPNWAEVDELIHQWQANALIVGIPTTVNNQVQYTTEAARQFAEQLRQQFHLPVHEVDERFSTVAARQQVFEHGGYSRLTKTEIDAVAAQLIIEHWFHS